MGGFSTAYDLVSSEYGWTDDTIGELPLGRFRQVTAAIQLRRYAQLREENSRFSWLARNVTGFIAAGFQIEKGKENTALKHAASLAMDDIESALLSEAPLVAPKENKSGSYERFMMMDKQMQQRGKLI